MEAIGTQYDQFVRSNAAKDFRDKIIDLYDQFIATQISRDMNSYDLEEAVKFFLR